MNISKYHIWVSSYNSYWYSLLCFAPTVYLLIFIALLCTNCYRKKPCQTFCYLNLLPHCMEVELNKKEGVPWIELSITYTHTSFYKCYTHYVRKPEFGNLITMCIQHPGQRCRITVMDFKEQYHHFCWATLIGDIWGRDYHLRWNFLGMS